MIDRTRKILEPFGGIQRAFALVFFGVVGSLAVMQAAVNFFYGDKLSAVIFFILTLDAGFVFTAIYTSRVKNFIRILLTFMLVSLVGAAVLLLALLSLTHLP